MNHETPKRMRGSLLERAAEMYDFQSQFRGAQASAPQTTQPATAAPALRAAAPVRTPRPGPHPFGAPALKIDRQRLAEHGYLVPGAAVDVLAEEFRLVKRQLLLTARELQASVPDKARMILVCSAKPDDGKTFCSINLALSLAAERDLEVVLVDADFAKPDVMAALGHSEGKGLLDALADPGVDLDACVHPTDVPRLSLLPAGTRSNNDTELLASDRTPALLAQLIAADPRRILVFDSPPALAASPAAVLAEQVGQVMMVVRADRTAEADLREAVTLLGRCEHIKLVLNAVSFNPGGRRFGSYYGQEDVQ